MYTNCPHHPAPSSRPLEFKLPTFAPDEKLAFVDSVCGTLVKSRFGGGAMYMRNPRFRGTAGEPFDYLVLLEEEPVGWHGNPKFLGRKRENHLRKRVATLFGQVVLTRGNGAPSAALGRNGPTLKPPAHASGSSLARGSPDISSTFFSASSFASLASLA